MKIIEPTNGRRIGIIGALTSEMEAIKAGIEHPVTQTISGTQFVQGSIHGVDVVAATSGVGKVFAAVCAQSMILAYQPDLIINIGVSGSLSKHLNIGDIAIADYAVQHDMDTTSIGDPPGLLSGLDIVQLPCSPQHVKQLQQSADHLGYHWQTGVIATGDVFMQDPARKQQVAETFSAISCEMEGASIGHVCYINQTPFCILRAISDNGDEDAYQDFAMSLEMAADRASRVLDDFLGNVGAWQRLADGSGRSI